MKRLALALLALAGLWIPAAAEAVIPGPNGPIAFTSGRDDGATTFSDANAQVWMLNGLGGTATRLSSGFNTYHHRHPTWSPDRTKLAYARCATSGCMFNGPWDIYVQDLLNGGTPLNITNSAQSEDRPAWSPDGTRIAYAKQTAATNWDIEARSADGTGGETTVATQASQEAGGWRQARAQWTPDSQFLIYAKYAGANDYDIRRAAADGSTPGGSPVDLGFSNDYQPAVSPDGDKICFTRDTNAAPNFKEIYIEVVSTPSPATPLVTTTADEFECAWSPDGTMIIFGRGAFGNGQILLVNADGTGGETPVTDVAGRFDGNADWAQNPAPTCAGNTVSTGFNQSVSIPLACSDAFDPPLFGPPSISRAIVNGPAHGSLGSIASDGTVTYTPNANFTGTDTFTYRGNDGTSNSANAAVTVNVAAPTPTNPAPTVSGLRAKRRFRKTRALPKLTKRRRGYTISFSLSEDARVTLSFERKLRGRRVRGRCVKPTRRNRSARRCTRYKKVRTRIRLNAKQGFNKVVFKGRLSRRRSLKPGRYRLTVVGRDSEGAKSKRKRASFRLLRAKRRRR